MLHPPAWLTAAPGQSAAALAAAGELGVQLDAWRVGGDDVRDQDRRFLGAYGVSPSGAALVRPDGFVAWRAIDGADASPSTLVRVLRTLLCRS